MKNKSYALSLILGLLLAVTVSPVFAQPTTQTFVVSAEVPRATSVGITAFQVNSATNAFTPTGTNFNFGTLAYNSANGIFLPDHFYAVDVSGAGGTGNPDVTVTYTEGANPNSPKHGLGWKSTATFVKVMGSGTNTTEAPITSLGPKQLLKDVSGDTVQDTLVAGGWLRVYVGIVSLNPASPDPSGAEVFSNADQPGTYDGTLLISATL